MTDKSFGKRALQFGAWLALSALVSCIGGDGLPNADVIHPLMIDNEATIAARRASYGKPGVNSAIELKRPLKAAPNGIELSAQMVFNETATPKSFAMRPQSRAGGGLYSDALTYTSSDSSIVAASGGVLQATGKLGNAYITASNSSGQPVEKFMFLTATPKKRVLTISNVSNPDLAQALIGVSSAGSAECPKLGNVCAFKGPQVRPYITVDQTGALKSDPAVADQLADANVGGARLLLVNSIDAAFKLKEMLTAEPAYDAVYLPDFKLMFAAKPLRYIGSVANTIDSPAIAVRSYGVEIGLLIGQKDFDQYYDYGNQLKTISVPNSRDLNKLAINLPGQLQPQALSAVIYADGSRVSAAAFRTQGVSSRQPVRYEYEYKYVAPSGGQSRGFGTQEDDDDGGGSVTDYLPRCSFSTSNFTPTFTGLGGELQLNFDGDFKWTDSGVDFDLEMKPLGFIGYTELDLNGVGSVKWECHMLLLTIPFDEVTLPLLGQVDLSVPVKASIRGEISQDNGGAGAKVAGPFLAVGSQNDVNKQGRVAVGLNNGSFYGPGIGAGNNWDLGLAVNLIPQLMRGTPPGAVVNKSSFIGPDFSLVLEGEIEWDGEKLFDFTISALDAAVGIRLVSTDTVDASGAKADSRERSINISFLATIDASVSFKVLWFTESIDLFSVDVPPIDLIKNPLSDQLGVDLLPSLQTKDAFNGFGDSSLAIGQITDGPISATLKNWNKLGRAILRVWLETSDGKRISNTVENPNGDVTFQKTTLTTGRYRIMADYRRDETPGTIPLSTMMDFGY
jgi:hypothetical protein